MNSDAQFLNIGGFIVRWNGVIIMLAIIAGIALACFIRTKQKRCVDDVLIASLAAMPVALIGARFYYCYNNIAQFGSTASYFELSNGGFGLYGGLFGAVIAIIAAARLRKVHAGELLDAMTPGIALAIAIGRWGAVFTGENTGNVAESLQMFPFAVFNETEGAWRSALFFYQSVIALTVCLVICLLINRRYVVEALDCDRGDIFLLFAILYSVPQGIFEQFRSDPLYFKTLFIQKLQTVPISLGMSAVSSGLALAIFILRGMKRKGIKLSTLWPVAACGASYLAYFNITLRFDLPSEMLSNLIMIVGAIGLVLTGLALFALSGGEERHDMRGESRAKMRPERESRTERSLERPARKQSQQPSYWD